MDTLCSALSPTFKVGSPRSELRTPQRPKLRGPTPGRCRWDDQEISIQRCSIQTSGLQGGESEQLHEVPICF